MNFKSDQSTRFVNIYTPDGRQQEIRSVATSLEYYHIPQAWRSARLVHLGPVAQEVDAGMVRNFPEAQMRVTPQGWLRTWDGSGRVAPVEWPEAGFVLDRANSAVISLDDVDGDEDRIEEMAAACPVLAVTEAHLGVRSFLER